MELLASRVTGSPTLAVINVLMMAIGGSVRGGIYGTAPNLRIGNDNSTLENSSQDVRYETDFRSVYARVLDNWMGSDSSAILGGDFRNGPNFI